MAERHRTEECFPIRPVRAHMYTLLNKSPSLQHDTQHFRRQNCCVESKCAGFKKVEMRKQMKTAILQEQSPVQTQETGQLISTSPIRAEFRVYKTEKVTVRSAQVQAKRVFLQTGA